MNTEKFEKFVVLLLAVLAIGWSAWFIMTQTTTLSDRDLQTAAWIPTAPPTPTATPEPTPEPTPTPTPEPVQTDPLADRAAQLLSGMTTEQKVWQLFIATPEEVAGVSPVTLSGDGMQAGLSTYPVGGLLYGSENFEDAEQIAAMTAGAQERAALGMFIACTEEGGTFSQLIDYVDGPTSDDAIVYKNEGPDIAAQNAAGTAYALLNLGFNTNLGPVCDVCSDPDNNFIGVRCMSDDFSVAAQLAAAAVESYKNLGVVAAVKHFPGVGTASENDLVLSRTLDELRQNEFTPFVSAIDAGAGMVLVSTVTVTDVDSVPACLSQTMVTDILRGELGYTGVIATTPMTDTALADYTQSEAAVRALQAGVDVLLAPDDLDACGQALLEAVQNGDITEERLNESVLRILYLKLQYNIIA